MTKGNNHILHIFLAAIVATGIGACSSENGGAPPPAAAVEEESAGTAAAAGMAEAMPDDIASGAAAQDDDGDPCTLAIQAGDTIAFSTSEMSVPSSCAEVTVTLIHTGQLPAAAMGHNWVLVPQDAVDSVAMAGMSAGLEGNYVPPADDRVVAATKIIGGGESDSVTFSLAALDAGTSYVYVCTFPGHWSIMRGTFTVTS